MEAAWFTEISIFSSLYLWAWIKCCFVAVARSVFDNLLDCATHERFKPVIQHESPPGLQYCLHDTYRKCEQYLLSSRFDCFNICKKRGYVLTIEVVFSLFHFFPSLALILPCQNWDRVLYERGKRLSWSHLCKKSEGALPSLRLITAASAPEDNSETVCTSMCWLPRPPFSLPQ